MRSDFPSGTVTFLFTDVEGSTTLLHELGAETYAEALAEHRRIVREACAAESGVEVDTQGDAFFFAFHTANGAVASAKAITEALAVGPMYVRIGLHTGTPHLTSEGYVGEDTHLGARIGASGHGGQILLSGATRALIDGELTDLGEHGLKDFAEPIKIFQLGRERFPPLKTISHTNLPRPASVFVGRKRETQEVVSLLSGSARFLTLTGAGGSGKTRLAIEAASELVPAFGAGVFWVGLATLRDPALVTETITETLGAKTSLHEHIGDRELLLLIDNLEHVVEVAPDLASLAEKCRNLRLLVTSREVLRVRGEVEYAVPALTDADAVSFFCLRARLEPDDAIAELCERLDNLPLALELAAARTAVLSPRQILDRLSARLDLLKGGRDVDARQLTLRATVDWSHDLLSAEEQALFRRLSVFVGGCTIEAAEAVAAADIDALQALVDRSLLRHSDERFWMLETIRQYGVEKLEAGGEAEELRQRHGSYFLALAETAEPAILGISPREWLDRLQAEHDNLRAALDWLETRGDIERALALGGAIWEFWCLRGHYKEGWRRLDHLLNVDERLTTSRAKALVGATHLAGNAGVPADEEEQRAEQALEANRELQDPWGIAYSEFQLAGVLAFKEDFAAAVPLAEASVKKLRELGDQHHALQAAERLAWWRLQTGRVDDAKDAYAKLLQDARAAGDAQIEARALTMFALWASDEGRHREALELLQQVYGLDTDMGDPNEIVMDVVLIARAVAWAGKAEPAALLLAGAEAMRDELGFPFPKHLVQIREETEEKVRAELEDAAFAASSERGRGLTRDDAASILDAAIDNL